jgi:hypothetical protein
LNIQHCVTELLKNGTTAAMVKAAASMQRPTCMKAEFETAIETVSAHIRENQQEEGVATVLVLLLADANGIVSLMRRKGVLRASRYKFQSGSLVCVVDAAIQIAPSLQMLPERVAYLRSVRALLVLAPYALQLRESLVLRLHDRKASVCKTLLVLVNTLFSKNWVGDRNEDSESLKHWSAEEFASAFSSLFVMLREEVGIVEEMWQYTDEQSNWALEAIYGSMLLDAAKLNEIYDSETLIDGLPYQARVEGNTVTVSAVDPDLEKSIRLGYIQTDQQVSIRAIGVARAFREQATARRSIQEYIREAFGAGMGELVQLVTEPIGRLVFGMPHSALFYSPLSTDILFLDEAEMLYGAGIENFQPKDGPSLRVSKNLTALDIIKVQRLFSFIDAVFVEKLQTFDEEQLRESLRVRSTIPIILHDQLTQILEWILPKEKVEEALKLLTLQGNEDYVDIQYRPLIKAGKWYVVAPAIVAKSNLLRNVVMANQLRTSATMAKDPMEAAVVSALKQAGFMVRANFKFNMNGKRETDILCWRDGELFVFECKNSYHPCSPHELRTSFEHLKTAEIQLDVRLAWLTDASNQAKLLKWLKWDVPTTKKVHTGIVTANRAFTGYRLGVHPVRQAHELINVLLRGYVACTDGQPPLRFWREEFFHATDLIDYLQGQAIVRIQYGLLEPFTRRVQIGTKTLAFENYTMNLQTAAESIEQALGVPRDADSAAPEWANDVFG